MNTQSVAAAQEFVRASVSDPPPDMPPISGGTTNDGAEWVCLDLGGATPYIVLTDPPELHATPVGLDLTVEWRSEDDNPE